MGRPSHMPKKSRTWRVICLRCDHVFDSWDKARNRICPECKDEIYAGQGHTDRVLGPYADACSWHNRGYFSETVE
jgi:hypothetical protein